MDHVLWKVKKEALACACSHHQPIDIQVICVENGALSQLAGFLRENGLFEVVVIADENTYRAAGAEVEKLLRAEDLSCRVGIVSPNRAGDVVADEQAIVQAMMEASPGVTQAFIAVGSGTIHDIVRFVASHTGKPFVSVPTAPSVDGFTSKGAPIIVSGNKVTVPAVAPIGVFADMDVLMGAPGALVAAGFGDMIGKYTSLFDWKFGRLAAGEPYCDAVERLTRGALDECVRHTDDIAARTERGIRVLMNALIESGLAMLLFGQSHPASGAEHHLSHYWEMAYLAEGKRQLLHGAKVGVACAEIAGLYRRLAFEEGALPESLAGRREDIAQLATDLPEPDTIRELLRKVGGPSTVDELGVSPELYARSLQEAHRVRLNRHTLLKAYNELLGTLS